MALALRSRRDEWIIALPLRSNLSSPSISTISWCGALPHGDHDQVIVLVLEAGCGKVRGAGAQQPPVTSSPITAAANREGEITGGLHRYCKRKAPKNDDCENYLGLSQSFFGGQIALLIFEVTSAFFGKFQWLTLTKFLLPQFELRG